MASAITSESDANRSGIFVEEGEETATLTVYARNRLVSWIVGLLGAFPTLGALLLAANGVRVSDYLTAFVMAGVALAIIWLTWRLGWRKRPFQIVFKRDQLEAGGRCIAYSDIVSVGIGGYGGDAFDPASMSIPRNYSVGPHVYVQLGERRMPVVIGLDQEQARPALDAFRHCLKMYRADGAPRTP